MFTAKRYSVLLVALVLPGPAGASVLSALSPPSPDTAQSEIPRSFADLIVRAIEEPTLRELVSEVLRRNPEIAAAQARARAAGQRGLQVRALPNPKATLSTFLGPPETRTGPQQLSIGFSQALPWFGKLALEEQAAVFDAAAVASEVGVKELDLVTETRRLFYELLYLDRWRFISKELHHHLTHHEETARVRYSTGAGHSKEVLKLQAEITMAEMELLDIQRLRVAIEGRLNALRDRPALTPIVVGRMPEVREVALDLELLTQTALRQSPELASSSARVERASTHVEIAEKTRRPDFQVGFKYTLVDPRDDLAGRLQPPEGNGDDILEIQGGLTLPVWRKSLSAALEGALAHQAAAEESRRADSATIAARVGDLAQRVELNWRRVRLLEDLLIVQVDEAKESARAGYIAGNLSALELLHAEHMRFEAQIAVARAKADYLIQIAELEGAVAVPLVSRMESSDHD